MAQDCFLFKITKQNMNFRTQAALPAKTRKAEYSSQYCDKVGCIVCLCCKSGKDLRLNSHHLGDKRQNFLQHLGIISCLLAISNTSAATIPINDGLERWPKMSLDSWCQWLSIIISLIPSTCSLKL